MNDETLASIYHIGEASSAEVRTVIQLLDILVGTCAAKIAADTEDKEKYLKLLNETHICRKLTYSLLGSLATLTMLAEDE